MGFGPVFDGHFAYPGGEISIFVITQVDTLIFTLFGFTTTNNVKSLGCEAFVVVCRERPDETLEKRLQEKSKIPLAVVPMADFLLLF